MPLREAFLSIKEQLVARLKELCSAESISISLAESCTGGRLGDYVTDISGSSQYFRGGVVAYSNAAKVKILRVPGDVIAQFGAVSSQTALAMAKGARELFESGFAVAVTGIAGPEGGSPGKAVGLVYIALVSGNHGEVHEYHFQGTRGAVKEQTCLAALQLMIDFLAGQTQHSKSRS